MFLCDIGIETWSLPKDIRRVSAFLVWPGWIWSPPVAHAPKHLPASFGQGGIWRMNRVGELGKHLARPFVSLWEDV